MAHLHCTGVCPNGFIPHIVTSISSRPYNSYVQTPLPMAHIHIYICMRVYIDVEREENRRVDARNEWGRIVAGEKERERGNDEGGEFDRIACHNDINHRHTDVPSPLRFALFTSTPR